MKIIKVIIVLLFITLFNFTFAYAEDCTKYDKLSKEFAKCTSDKLKNKTSKKADDIKTKTAKKIEQGKKKLKNFNFKEKLKKFKNSKSLKEFTEK